MTYTQTWKNRLMAVVFAIGCIGLVMGNAMAAEKTGRRASGSGFLATLERSVGLTPEQRDAIQGLMAQQRESMKKVRQETDTQIRAVLTPDQQKKFDSFLAEQKAKRFTRGA